MAASFIWRRGVVALLNPPANTLDQYTVASGDRSRGLGDTDRHFRSRGQSGHGLFVPSLSQFDPQRSSGDASEPVTKDAARKNRERTLIGLTDLGKWHAVLVKQKRAVFEQGLRDFQCASLAKNDTGFHLPPFR